MSSIETNKQLHLFTGYSGNNGNNGKSLYELYKENIDNDIDKDSFNSFISSYDVVLSSVDEVTAKLFEVETLLSDIDILNTNANVEMLQIGTILFSATPPVPASCWLPFGNPNYTYADEDYPELAAIVKSFSSEYVVDDTHFRLANPNYKNRYIYVSDTTNYPDGNFMESQIPNIKTTVTKSGVCSYYYISSVSYSRDSTKTWCGTKSCSLCGVVNSFSGFSFETVSNSSTSTSSKATCSFTCDYSSILPEVYKKESITDISGHCLAMNCWIKAKMRG